MQVIPDGIVAEVRRRNVMERFAEGKSDWKAVIIGNPSGRMRRMNFLETGRWSRWSEIRKLNMLVEEDKLEE